MKKIKEIVNKLIDYRYLVFLILFVFCVAFKIHGSSIGIYNSYIVEKIDPAIKEEIIGYSRGVRSDEWMVHTPYYFSQKYNNYNKYSHQMSFSGQNMILGYNAPVKDITLIGKPFTWGYMLLGNERGLSWYWCMKLFTLILISFEFIMILTKGNRKLSLLGTLLIAFAPPLQWWFVPHITDVFIWMLIVTTLTYHFFTADTKWKKILFTILLPCSAIGYALALFPSCQIPLAYLSLALIIVFLIRDKDKITFKRKEWYRILFVVLLAFGVLSYFITTSLEDIKLFTNTVYPGSRISTGGDRGFKHLLTDLTVLFLPYKAIPYLNNCEVSTFIHLGPLFMILFPKIYKNIKGKKDNLIGLTLFVALIIEIWFMVFGFPEIVSKITLFSYINRMHLVYGFTSVLFTIWSIYVINKHNINFKLKEIILLLALFIVCYCLTIDKGKLEYLSLHIYIAEIIFFALIVLFILKKKNIALIMLSILIVISSFPINPISRGISSITNHPSSKIITKIVKKDNGYWVATDSSIYANYVLALGGKVVDATNMYPDFDKWYKIDKKKKDVFCYNRYANMTFDLVHEKTSIFLDVADNIHVKLNYKDLNKLKIKYIFTLNKIDDDLKEEDIKFKTMYKDKQIYIYKIK